MDDPNLHNITSNSRKGQRRKQLAIDSSNDGNAMEDELKKRQIHREIERQRRQEMGNLFASLRSLLPLEYIKGKRAMSDHINEAAKYVQDLQNNVKELSAKRDELKKLSNSSADASESSSNMSSNYSPTNVVVNPCLNGFEILINSGLSEQDFPFSRVLEVLLGEGLDVVSCSCSKVNERLLHTIQTEVNDFTVDVSELQQKLTEVIS